MPFSRTAKSMCVFYALLISCTLQTVASGQNYSGQNYSGRSDSGQSYSRQNYSSESDLRSNRNYDGMLDQLSRGESTVTLRRSQFPEDLAPLRRDDRTAQLESRLRPINGAEDAVTLRPQPMSVRQTSFETTDQSDSFYSGQSLREQSQQTLDRMNAEEQFQSFIDRENAALPQEKENPTDFVTRIGVNLVFVLALAIGVLLTVRVFQKGKLDPKKQVPADLAGLKIDQVLQVTRGVSLYLVDSVASKILVAVDGGGIKSVNVLPARFEDELDEPEAFSRASDSPRSAATAAQRQSSRRGINTTSTSDIDENLIKLLLSKSKEAA